MDSQAAEGKEITTPLNGIQGSSDEEYEKEGSYAIPSARSSGPLRALNNKGFRQIGHSMDYLQAALSRRPSIYQISTLKIHFLFFRKEFREGTYPGLFAIYRG